MLPTARITITHYLDVDSEIRIQATISGRRRPSHHTAIPTQTPQLFSALPVEHVFACVEVAKPWSRTSSVFSNMVALFMSIYHADLCTKSCNLQPRGTIISHLSLCVTHHILCTIVPSYGVNRVGLISKWRMVRETCSFQRLRDPRRGPKFLF
jgi:hypothetical protein